MRNVSRLPAASDLHYFVEVGTTLNISRAAERVGISQPSLSLSIQRLEHAVGTSLLIRNKSGVVLTKSGLRLLSQARVLLSEWDKVCSDALRDTQEVRGRFTIGCHPAVAMYSLPDILPRLLTKWPDLEIKLAHDLSRKITEDVISFKVDFGIVINPTEHPDLVIKPLASDEVSLWVKEKMTIQQDPQNGEAVIAYDPELVQAQTLLKLMQKKKWEFRRHLTSSNLDVIAAMVSHGAAAGILPSRVALRQKSLGLKLYSKDAPKFSDELCLVFRADAQKTRASRAIVETIENAFSA